MKNYDKIYNFHKTTIIKNFDKTIPKEEWPEEWKKIQQKGYIRLPQIILSRQNNCKINKSLFEVLISRKSIREFTDKKKITETQLSRLLYFSVGNIDNSFSRFYPSAGARYPLETYIVVMNKISPKINIGLYHYHVRTHSLELLWRDDRVSVDIVKTLDQKWAEKSQIFVINTAIFSRTSVKYGIRSYRHIMCETGHVGQNYYLVSTALGLGCCAIGGYKDRKINELLDIDGTEEAVIALHAIGVPN